MSTDPDQIRAQIEQTRGSLSDDVNALADQVNPKNVMHRQTAKVTGAFGSAKDKVMGVTSGVAGSAGETLDSAGDLAAGTPTKVKRSTQGNPLAAGVIAFGAGLLIASLIPASERERDTAATLKDQAEPITDQLKDIAKESVDHLQEPAQDALQSVKEAATDAATTVKDEGQSAAENVRDDAQGAKETIQEQR
jgi:gas vesicle protein